MFSNIYFIESLGVIGLLIGTLSWSYKTRKDILILQCFGNIFFIVHFYLLNAFSGMIMTAICFFRNIVFIKNFQNKYLNNSVYFYFFITLFFIFLIYFWEGYRSIFPFLGCAIGAYAIKEDNAKKVRFYMLLSCFAWIPYVIIVHSVSGIINQTINALGLLYGMHKHKEINIYYFRK